MDDERLVGIKYHPKTCFLQRNRIIAGLSDVVVIPEAAERSGSLNTAAHALEQGKEILRCQVTLRDRCRRGAIG